MVRIRGKLKWGSEAGWPVADDYQFVSKPTDGPLRESPPL